MIHVGDRVRLVRLIGVAAPALAAMVGHVGEVRRVWERGGRQRVEVAFAVFDRGSRDLYTFSVEELEIVPEIETPAVVEPTTQVKAWRTRWSKEERDGGDSELHDAD